MKCKCGGEMLYRREESVFYCQRCGVIVSEFGDVLQGAVRR